jgi:hypothetical protein
MVTGFGAGIVLGLAMSLHTAPSSPREEEDEHATAEPHGWSTQWIVGGAVFRRMMPSSRDLGMVGVNELGIGFRHRLVRRFSLSFALGGAVFHHRVHPGALRHEVGLWTDVAVRRDILGWERLRPYVAVHLHGRWFDPIESHQWTLMGGVGPAGGIEWRFNARAGVLAQGEVFWEAAVAERDSRPVRTNVISAGGRAALAVHY